MRKIIYIFIFLIIFFVWDNQLFTIHRALADQKITFEDPKMLNNFGMPGNIDTPTAESFPDGQFSASSAIFGGTIRTNLSFQISENITAAFRYSRIPSVSGDHRGYFWDRSFDVHYRAFKEKKFLPAIAIGLRDFVGTGLYSSEYIAASKSIGKEIKISAGLGWGRMAGTNSFSNVFGLGNDRAGITANVGGTFNLDQLFSGKNSPFLSIKYRLNDKFDLIGELSSDAYSHETSSSKGLVRKSDLNIGLKYQLAADVGIMGNLMHGNSVGIVGILALNPKNSPNKTGFEPAPMPILDKTTRLKAGGASKKDLFEVNKRLLQLDGIKLLRLNLIENKLIVDIIDRNYLNVAQMIGRVARILSKTAPSNVDNFNIFVVDYSTGFYISEVSIDRLSLEKNELLFEGPSLLWESVKFHNVPNEYFKKKKNDLTPFTWSFYPDVDIMLFDPHAPIRWSIGWQSNLEYRIGESTTLSGSLRQPILGTMDDVKRGPKVGLPNVRSDFMYYYRDIGNSIYLENLTIDQYIKPLENVYGQINLGYLEMMYMGARSEIIWKDRNKPYGFGLDIAKARKRDTFGDFSLKNDSYSTYLASFYYDLPNRWNVKIDAGKYLAGDYGTTLAVARDFNNGWEIGAYATLTDVSFDTFGEGSFDKGITLRAPVAWFTGKKSQGWRNTIISPIRGDGGAKLELEENKYLYRKINKYGENAFRKNWKRVYR